MGEKDETNTVHATAIVVRRDDDERLRLVEEVDAVELRQRVDDFKRAKYAHGSLAAIAVTHNTTRLNVDRISGDDLRDVDAVCTRLARRIHADAKGCRRNVEQEYTISAFYGEGDAGRFPTDHLRVRVKWCDTTDDDNADRPVEKDVVRSLQKGQRDALEFGLKSGKSAWAVLARMIERADAREERREARIDKLEDKLDKVNEAKEDALDRSQDRRDKAEERKVWRSRLGELFDSLKVMLPFAAARWLGGKDAPLPAMSHPIMEQANVLFDVVTRDQEAMEGIIAALIKQPVAHKAFDNLMALMQDTRELQRERAKMQVAAEEKARNGAAAGESEKKTNGHATSPAVVKAWW